MHKRILFFHSHIWRYFFRDLLSDFRKQGAEILIVSDHAELHHYRHLRSAGCQQIILPDFRKQMDFEATQEGNNKIETLMSSCEHACGKSTARILLSAERTLGRGFSRGFYHWFNPPLQKYCLKHPQAPSLVLKRYFSFFNTIFQEFQPNLVLSRSISEPYSLTSWFLARRYETPMLSCRFSKLASSKTFWTDDYAMYNTCADEGFKDLLARNSEPDIQFTKQISSYRNKPVIVDYIAQNWNASCGITTLAKGILRTGKEELRYYRKGCKGLKPSSTFEKAKEAVRIAWYQKRHFKFFTSFSVAELEKRKYVYLPLHKEPELMLNFESPTWHDQRHLVKLVASMLPTGYTLFVKEHRFNWGRRYTDYLDYITRLPGVALINPFEDQFKYIKNADIVITDNGSSGWEGLMLKRPVITLEKTLYDAPGLTQQVLCPRELDKTMLLAVENPPKTHSDHDRLLALRLQAEDETTMPIDDMLKDASLSITAIDNHLNKVNTRA